MTKNHNKIAVFLVGLIAGILIGGVAVYYIALGILEQERNTALAEYQLNNTVEPEVPLVTEDQTTDTNIKPSFTKSEKVEQEIVTDTASPFVDTLLVMADTLEVLDTLAAVATLDTDTMVDGDEDIIIKRDQLVAVGEQQVVFLNDTLPELSTTDSLLEAVTEVKMQRRTTVYEVEYWKSPINFKGYKLGKNKLLLYGLSNQELKGLYEDGEALYVKTTDNVYQLHVTNEFKPFVRVTDEALLKTLADEN